MSIDKAALKKKARKAFVTKARKRVESFIGAWPHMLDTYLETLNDVVEAGRVMGVTEADTFSPEEIKGIATDLAPLAELEMRDEIRDYIVPILRTKKFDDEVLAGFDNQEEKDESPGSED